MYWDIAGDVGELREEICNRPSPACGHTVGRVLHVTLWTQWRQQLLMHAERQTKGYVRYYHSILSSNFTFHECSISNVVFSFFFNLKIKIYIYVRVIIKTWNLLHLETILQLMAKHLNIWMAKYIEYVWDADHDNLYLFTLLGRFREY